MNSAIVQHLEPEFEPVAVVWSDAVPHDALQFTAGRFGCILHLFAEASLKGRVAGGSRDTIVCPGGRAAVGFGVEFVESEAQLDHYSAIFSKGLESAPDRARAYTTARAAPPAPSTATRMPRGSQSASLSESINPIASVL